MKLLLDTHVVIASSRRALALTYPRFGSLLLAADHRLFVSAATIWEIAIKVRIGKLRMDVAPDRLVPMLHSLGMAILAVEHQHATASIGPEPPTKDPFDRMLLAQCAVENLRLVTVDRALADHPLAWRGE